MHINRSVRLKFGGKLVHKNRTIVIVGTLDTKGDEVKYIKDQIEKMGCTTLIVDSGMRGSPVGVKPDISREAVAKAAGSCIEKIEREDRGPAEEVMMRGVADVVKELYANGKLHGVIAVGGTDGSILAAAGMRALPIGVPKLLVTPIMTMAEPLADTKDITMMHSVTDILGINTISRKIFDNAAGAIVGMVEAAVETKILRKNLIAATMFGSTTPAVVRAKSLLEEKGYEVVVFTPNIGAKAMEELIEQGVFAGVLDITTHDITDALLGGLLPAGPDRLEAAGRKGIAQIVVPGCVDFIDKGPLNTLPPEYRERKFYYFNPLFTLVRTSRGEMTRVGKVFADKLSKAVGPTALVFPLRGLSMYNLDGGALYDPEADNAFLEALRKHLKPHVKLVEVDAHINDPVFAETCVSILIDMLKKMVCAPGS